MVPCIIITPLPVVPVWAATAPSLASSCDYTQIESDTVKRGAQTFKVFHQNRHALMSLPVAAVWSDVVWLGGFGAGVVATASSLAPS